MNNTLFNPNWVFSAILIAIIANAVFIYVIKPTIDKLFSRFSSRYKAYRDKKKKAYDKFIDNMANDPTFLIFVFINALKNLVIWIGCLIIIIIFYVVIEGEIIFSYLARTEIDKYFIRVIQIIVLICVIISIRAYYHFSSDFRSSYSAFKKYLESKSEQKETDSN